MIIKKTLHIIAITYINEAKTIENAVKSNAETVPRMSSFTRHKERHANLLQIQK